MQKQAGNRRGFHASIRRGKRQTGREAPLLTVLALVLAVSGCGYRADVEGLPEGASTLGIAPVRNLTYTGELDVGLNGALRDLLSRNPAFLLAAPEDSQLVLEVSLTRMEAGSTQALSGERPYTLTRVLQGTINLRRRRDDTMILAGEKVSARSDLVFPDAPVVTPAVEAQATKAVLAAFAEQVERRLYRHF